MLATASSAPARRAQKTGEIYVQGERGSQTSSLSRVTWVESRRPRVYQGRRPSKFPVCVSSASSRPAFPTDQSPRKACSSDPVEALRPASWSGRSQQVAGPSQPVTGGLGLGSGPSFLPPPGPPPLLPLLPTPALSSPAHSPQNETPTLPRPGGSSRTSWSERPPARGILPAPASSRATKPAPFPVRPRPSAPSRIVLARAP